MLIISNKNKNKSIKIIEKINKLKQFFNSTNTKIDSDIKNRLMQTKYTITNYVSNIFEISNFS